MKKIKIEVKTKEIKSGLFQYDFPKIKDLDYGTICFKVKETIRCNDDVLLEKNDLIPFYSRITSWGKDSPGVVFDFRKDGFNLDTIDVEEINVDFEYNILTKKRKKEIKQNQKMLFKKSEEHIKTQIPIKRVTSNIINLINLASKRHNFSIANDNIEELLKQIDYYLIICSAEMNAKYNISTIVDPYLPAQIILCIKKDMTSEVIFATDYKF